MIFNPQQHKLLCNSSGGGGEERKANLENLILNETVNQIKLTNDGNTILHSFTLDSLSFILGIPSIRAGEGAVLLYQIILEKFRVPSPFSLFSVF